MVVLLGSGSEGDAVLYNTMALCVRSVPQLRKNHQRIIRPEEPIFFFLKKIVIYERAMLFFLVLYALLMYTYESTVHDLSLLCKTINLRILSSLRVVSKKDSLDSTTTLKYRTENMIVNSKNKNKIIFRPKSSNIEK